MLVTGSTQSQPLYRSHEIRSIEQASMTLSPAPALMERAGKAAAELAIQIIRQQLYGIGSRRPGK